MKLADVMDLAVSSRSADWTHVPSVFLEEHTDLAIFNDNVSVSLAWGKDHMQGDSWQEEWSDAFPDSKVYGVYVDVRWNGVAVRRELLLVVDGGRAYLPAGRHIIEGKKRVGQRVSHEQASLARIVHGLALAGNEFEDYMDRANIQIE